MPDTEKEETISATTQQVLVAMHKQFPKSLTIESALTLLKKPINANIIALVKNDLDIEIERNPQVIPHGDRYTVVNYFIFLRMALWILALLFSGASLMSGMDKSSSIDIVCLLMSGTLLLYEFI